MIIKSKAGDDRTILGIDPGTGRCGWAIIKKLNANAKMVKDNQKIELLDCGCLETPAKTPLSQRLQYIYDSINDLIKKYHPGELAIEELFFVKNIKTGLSVGHARGVVMLAAQKNRLKIYEYKPNEVKLAIVGFGHATKEQVSKMLKLHLKGCIIKQDDAADAVAIALTHLQCVRCKK